MGTIYKITNTVNGKCYIGQTIRDVKKRVHEHFFHESKGNSAIKNALRKHGHDAFIYNILHNNVDADMLDALESERSERPDC